MSSHILSEVERMCDRIAIIREGIIIEQGTLDEMRHLTRTQITVATKDTAETVKIYLGCTHLRLINGTRKKLVFLSIRTRLAK